MDGFGERLAKLRKSRSLTQTQLADILNMGKSTIAMYESGGRLPTPDTIVLLAEQFNVTTDYLLKGDIRQEDIIVQSEAQKFIERINNLGEFERKILKERVEELIRKLEEL